LQSNRRKRNKNNGGIDVLSKMAKESMKRYILTGTPGSGKTSILRALEERGFLAVEEAATDIVSYEQALGNLKPWENPNFIDKILTLQKERQLSASSFPSGIIQFYDRSPICTYALALHLNFKPSADLLEEIERMKAEQIYQKKVFFIGNLGFCTPTEARKISFEDSLAFEKLHEEAYAKFGFECVLVPPTSLVERVDLILKVLTRSQYE